MFLIQAEGSRLRVLQRERVLSGSGNAYVCRFLPDEGWAGLDLTALFRAGAVLRETPLDSEGKCRIPWEVLEKPGLLLRVGLRGSSNGGQGMPAVWGDLEYIQPGACRGPAAAAPPATDLYAQVLAKANEAASIARELREAAGRGDFDGAAPVRGTDYWTREDQAQIVAEVLTCLPAWEGGEY